MEKQYVVTADGYTVPFGSEIYLIGVFSDEAKAKEAMNDVWEQYRIGCHIHDVEVDTVYPLKKDRKNYDLFKNSKYLGGYIE